MKVSKTQLIGIIVVFFGIIFGIIGFIFWRRSKNGKFQKGFFEDLVGDGNGKIRAASRSFAYLTNPSETNALFALGFNANSLLTKGKYQPLVPKTSGNFLNVSREKNRKNIKWQVDNFDYFVAPLAQSFNIPRCLIYMLMGVETSATAEQANYNKDKYVRLCNASGNGDGPMQMTAIVATETIQIAEVKDILDDYHIKIVRDSVGVQKTQQIFQKRNQKLNSKNNFVDNKVLTASDIKDAELNIFLGITLLANLLDDFSEDRLHQVVYSYSRGNNQIRAYGYSDWTVNDFLNKANNPKQSDSYHKIGVDYIKKCLGPDGALDIIINDLGIVS